MKIRCCPQFHSEMIPGRDILAEVYKSIKARPLKDKYCEALCVRFDDDGANLAKYTIAVEVMLEAGVLEADEENRIFAPNYSGKANLEETPIMRRLLEIGSV